MTSELERLIQVGTVTAVEKSTRKVRVKFQDTGLTSDWLRVVKNSPSISVSQEDGHAHSVAVSHWMPSVNDIVLVIYLPVFNSDGFVIGGI